MGARGNEVESASRANAWGVGASEGWVASGASSVLVDEEGTDVFVRRWRRL